MAHYPSDKVFLQAGLLASLIWGVGGQVQANSSNEGIANNVITAAAICGPWQPAEAGCIDATKLANSSLHFDGTQFHRSGFQYGYYRDGEFHTFDDSDWTGDAWKSAIGGFKGSEGWLTTENNSSGKQLTRRWVSNINGGVKLTNRLTVTAPPDGSAAADSDPTVKVTVLIDGEPKHEFEAVLNKSTEYIFNADMHKGSVIDFLVESAHANEVDFDLNTDISIRSGLAIRKGDFHALSEPLPLPTLYSIPTVYSPELLHTCGSSQCGFSEPNLAEFFRNSTELSPLLGNPISQPYPINYLDKRFNSAGNWKQDFENGSLVQGSLGSMGFEPIGKEIFVSIEGQLFYQDKALVQSIPALNFKHNYLHPPGSTGVYKKISEVGLLNQVIFESSSYLDQYVADSILNRGIHISEKSSVQNQHTLGSFLNPSENLCSHLLYQYCSYYPYHYNVLPISGKYVDFMTHRIMDVADSPFLDTRLKSASCASQKGDLGFFSNIGLIEWSSEGNIDLNSNEGFIDNVIECYTKEIQTYEYSGPASISEDGYTSGEIFVSPAQPQGSLVNLPAFLSGEFLEYVIEKELWKYKDDWLRIIVEADEFTLTDPNGLKLSYSFADGFNNEITDTFFERKDFFDGPLGAPLPSHPLPTSGTWGEIDGEPLCNPDEGEDNIFPENNSPFPQPNNFNKALRKSQFYIFIPKRVEGKYTLEVASNTFKPQVVVGDKNSTTLVTPDTPCDNPPPDDLNDPGDPDPCPSDLVVPGDPCPVPGIIPGPGDPGMPGDPGNPTPDPKKPTPTPYVDIIIRPPGTPTPEPVPEPSQALGLLAAALVGGWWLKRCRS